MAFLDDTYEDAQQIIGGEFTESVLIAVDEVSEIFDGIFDETFLAVEQDGYEYQSDFPRVEIDIKKVNDFFGQELEEGPNTFITIRGKKYRIKKVLPDGTGIAQVWLKNASP